MSDTAVFAIGPVCLSACSSDSPDAIVEFVNQAHPTGIASQWRISADDFADGNLNPHPCECEPDRSHYLLTC